MKMHVFFKGYPTTHYQCGMPEMIFVSQLFPDDINDHKISQLYCGKSERFFS
jgi:hypothetical protein